MNIPENLKNIDLKSINLKEKKTQAAILAVIAALIAISMYIYFVFTAQIVRVFKLMGDTARVRSELKSAKASASGAAKLEEDLREYSDKVESYEKKLPAEQEIPSILEDLSKMARASDIKIVSIEPSTSYFKDDKTKSKSEIYREIPILIKAKSGYHQLGRFLSGLENADRFMKVADIDIRSGKVNPREHDVELMICTYVLLGQK